MSILRREPPLLALLLGAVALVVAFHHHYLVPDAMMTGGDYANLFWPGKVFLQRAWEDGVVPLWNPYNYLGTPFMATMQQGAFYPLDWLVFLLFPAHTGLNVYVLLHLSLAAAGMVLWLRSVAGRQAWWIALFAAVYPCSGWFWGHQEHINQVATAAWFPWLAWCAWRFGKGEDSAVRFVARYAALSAVQFLAGHPQGAIYTHLVNALMLAAIAYQRAGDLPALLRSWTPLAAAGALAAALCLVQLLPGKEMANHSVRQLPDPRYALAYSMPPDVLATSFLPNAFGNFRDGYRRLGERGEIPDLRAYNEYGQFLGPAVLLLAAFALWPGADLRRAAAFLGLIVMVAFAFALGGNLDPRRLAALEFTEFQAPGLSPYDLFIKVVPLMEGFRVPARWLMVAMWALATLAALGWMRLSDRLRALPSPPHRLLAGALLAVAVAGPLWWGSRGQKFRFPGDASLTLRLADSDRVLGERFLDNRLYRLWLADDDLVAKDEREFETTFQHGDPVALRYTRFQPNLHMVAGIPMEDGYEEGLSPTLETKSFFLTFNRNFRSPTPDRQLMALLGIGRLFSDAPVDTSLFERDPSLSIDGRPVLANPLHRGAAFWELQAAGIDFAAFKGDLATGRSSAPTRNTVLMEYGGAPDWERPWPRIEALLPTANRVQLRLRQGNAPSDALLAMGYYPGWKFLLDRGDTVPVEWRSPFHAIIPRGKFERREALLAYQPESYRVGLFGSAAALAVLVFLSSFARRQTGDATGSASPVRS
ncbi:MAG: hypothetical protein SF028_00830 [Candidatus Sumerlaeia bacterium]|nr:hypothetical protein [Candidatus Sumerlaeia bacterium]